MPHVHVAWQSSACYVKGARLIPGPASSISNQPPFLAPSLSSAMAPKTVAAAKAAAAKAAAKIAAKAQMQQPLAFVSPVASARPDALNAAHYAELEEALQLIEGLRPWVSTLPLISPRNA